MTSESGSARTNLPILGILWLVATTLAMSASFYSFENHFIEEPWVREAFYGWSRNLEWLVKGAIFGASIGALTGAAQFVVLRVMIPGRRWVPWIPALMGGIAAGGALWICLWALIRDTSDRWLLYSPAVGILVGVIQAPMIIRHFSWRMALLWVVSHTCAWTAIVLTTEYIANRTDWDGYLPFAINGAILGLLTGIALILMVRKSEKVAAA